MNRTATLIAALLATLALSQPASALEIADQPLPPSACRQAWMEPGGALAERCQDRGWVVWERLVVTPRGVVTRYAIPACKTTFPDGNLVTPVAPRPCYFGFGGPQDAKMFYVTLDGVRHFVKKAR